jgi:hypothetical protein
LTRRQVLVGAGLVGACGVAPVQAMPWPAGGRRAGVVRAGLLQSAPPFVDRADLSGSRERAFAALHVLMERSAGSHGDLDWLVAGIWPLAAGYPLPAVERAAFALDPGSPEVCRLRGFARRWSLRLTLGGWWRGRDGGVSRRLVAMDPDGRLTVHPLPAGPARPAADGFAAACARLGLPGAHVAPASDPALAPYVVAPSGGGTRLIGADGRTIAEARTPAETCVVGDLPG